jgi:parallel beta-helix repeat protein
VWGGCAVGQTGSASPTESAASVGGRVISDTGGQVEYWAQYGLTTAYGAETAHSTVTVGQNVPTSVAVEIGGLARSMKYHYRLCASDSQQKGGPGCGADRTFTTQSFACGETVTTSVRLTGSVFCADTAVLVVGANGIDINLAGYELSTPFGVGGGSAVIVNDGFDDVTIRNGSLFGATLLTGASRNLIRGVEATGGGDVIHIEGGASNAIRSSILLGRGSAITVVDSDDLVISGNRATSAIGTGIQVQGDGARIANNELPLANSVFASGIALRGSDGRVVGNRITGPWLAGGLVLVAGADNVIAENEVSDTGEEEFAMDAQFGDGIFVRAFTAGTLLRNNFVQRNTGDGIQVQASSARLRDNTAVENGDFGIDAAAGVTDQGGNTAFGNGNPLQCRNVLCQ